MQVASRCSSASTDEPRLPGPSVGSTTGTVIDCVTAAYPGAGRLVTRSTCATCAERVSIRGTATVPADRGCSVAATVTCEPTSVVPRAVSVSVGTTRVVDVAVTLPAWTRHGAGREDADAKRAVLESPAALGDRDPRDDGGVQRDPLRVARTPWCAHDER